MTPSLHRGPALAALLLLVACPASAAIEVPRIDAHRLGTLERRLPGVEDRLAEALAPATPWDAAALALPESRAALAQTLRDAGVPAGERAVVVEAIVDAARHACLDGVAWTEPLVDVGSFTLSLQQLREVVGPREGRDRREVLARLLRLTAGDGQVHEDAWSPTLVPDLVAADERARATTLLARLQRAVLAAGDDQ